jgi:uncharacterized protein YutE (UPF0331/DUF86 family)
VTCRLFFITSLKLSSNKRNNEEKHGFSRCAVYYHLQLSLPSVSAVCSVILPQLGVVGGGMAAGDGVVGVDVSGFVTSF